MDDHPPLDVYTAYQRVANALIDLADHLLDDPSATARDGASRAARRAADAVSDLAALHATADLTDTAQRDHDPDSRRDAGLFQFLNPSHAAGWDPPSEASAAAAIAYLGRAIPSRWIHDRAAPRDDHGRSLADPHYGCAHNPRHDHRGGDPGGHRYTAGGDHGDRGDPTGPPDEPGSGAPAGSD